MQRGLYTVSAVATGNASKAAMKLAWSFTHMVMAKAVFAGDVMQLVEQGKIVFGNWPSYGANICAGNLLDQWQLGPAERRKPLA